MSNGSFGSSIRQRLRAAPALAKVPATLALIGVVGVGVSACGSSSAGTSSSGSASSSASSSASGGTLTIYEGSAPPSLNPELQSSNQAANNLAYDSLLVQDGTQSFAPELAQSFGYVGSGNREFQIVLRKNVKFSDGSVMTAAGIEAYMKATIKANDITSGTFPLSGFSTPNSTTLDIHFSRAFPDAELQFDDSGAFGTPVSAADVNSKELDTDTFGAGPYELDKSATTAGTTYTFVKNPNYYDPARQHWSKVVITVIGDNASRLESVEAGTDAMEQGTPSEDATASSAGLKLDSNPPTSIYGIMILDRQGKMVPALGNQKVREALNYAVNRPADAKALDGSADEQVAAPGFLGRYSSDVYTYDVAKAKQLLSEAGYPNGFTLPILYESTDPLSSTVAQVLVPELKAIGVTVKFSTAPSIQAYGQDMGTGKYPAVIQQMQGMAFTVTLSRIFEPGGLFNPLEKTAPTPSFQTQFLTASAASGSAATTDFANLGRYIAQQGWLVDVVGLASTYYASKDLNVPAAYGVFPDPVYMTPAS